MNGGIQAHLVGSVNERENIMFHEMPDGNPVMVKYAPYVVTGPDQTQQDFLRHLVELQLAATPYFKDKMSYLKRLSAVEEISLDGVIFEPTTQFILEKKRKLERHWNTVYGPHGWHRYVGRFPPHVVRSLLNQFGAEAESVVLDPFCGSGTTLVESRLLGIPAIGIEVCPLSTLISKVKSQFHMDTEDLSESLLQFSSQFAEIKEDFMKKHLGYTHTSVLDAQFNLIPSFPNLERWFTREAFLEVSIAVSIISSMHSYSRDCFLVALSSVMRSIGNQDVDVVRAEYRRTPRENVDVCRLLTKRLKRYMSDIKLISETHNLQPDHHIRLIHNDMRKTRIPNSSVNFIITSPPYGVETLSYLRTHLLSYHVLKHSLKTNPYEHRDEIIGSEYLTDSEQNLRSPRTEQITSFFEPLIQSKSKKTSRRAYQMRSFYRDMEIAVDLFSNWVMQEGKVAFVVGNKRIGKTLLPTDRFMEAIFNESGFELEMKIAHKLKCNNTNSQVPWQDKIISDEFILVFKRS